MMTDRPDHRRVQPLLLAASNLRRHTARGIRAGGRALSRIGRAVAGGLLRLGRTRVLRQAGAFLVGLLQFLRRLLGATLRLLARLGGAVGRAVVVWGRGAAAVMAGIRLPRSRPKRLNRFEIDRIRRVSWHARWVAAASAGVLGIAALLPVVTGRTTPRWYQMQASRLAVEQAQESGADAWAAEPMFAARAMLQVAVVEHRHQELRFYFLRDFTQAEALLRDAEAKAERANELALVRRTSARNQSQEAITRAARSVGRSVSYAAAMNLGAYDRTLLQKSRLRLQEAEILHDNGRYALATDRARDATVLAETVSDHASQAVSRFKDTEMVRNWRRWIDATIEESRRSDGMAIIVYKEKHQLTLYNRGRAIRNYVADMGYNSMDRKLRAGDLATPEGRYRITEKKPVGKSAYHMALLLDYPNEEDRQRLEALKRAKKVHRSTSLGNLIEIHGEGGRGRDWTKGCVALSNADIEDLFSRVSVGTPVTIVGGDGNGGTFTRLVDAHNPGAAAGVD